MEDTLFKILYLTTKATLNIVFRFRIFLPEDSLPVLRVIVHCGMTYSGVSTSGPTHTHKILSAFLLNNINLLKVKLISYEVFVEISFVLTLVE